MYEIIKVFNNNLVQSKDNSGNEVFLLGPGIGFKKKAGQRVDNSKIEKVYKLSQTQIVRVHDISKYIPSEFFEWSSELYSLAICEGGFDLNPQFIFSLAEHLAYAVRRLKDQIVIPNLLLEETKALYPKEYAFGVVLIDQFHTLSGYMLPKDEASYIAIHLVNASQGNSSQSASEIIGISSQILETIKKYHLLNSDPSSHSRTRLYSHLKYLAQRINKQQQTPSINFSNRLMYNSLSKANPTAADCVNEIADNVRIDHDYTLNIDEKLYILIHIIQVADKQGG